MLLNLLTTHPGRFFDPDYFGSDYWLYCSIPRRTQAENANLTTMYNRPTFNAGMVTITKSYAAIDSKHLTLILPFMAWRT